MSSRRIGIGAENTVPPETPKTAGASEASFAPTGPSFAQSRAVRELYLARLAKIDFEERSGKLMPRYEVVTTAFTQARIIRDHLLNIPDRLAALLAVETDVAKTHKILTAEIRKALIELSVEDR